MIRFAWTRFRTQALVGAGVLAIAAIVLAVTGIQLAHAYDAAVAVCTRQGNCATTLGNGLNSFPSQGDLNTANGLNALGLAVPALIGMFWGAPLVAREFETGTFRLAWTQGITRVRWLAAKLAVAGVAAIAAGELFSLMVTWWSSPIRKAQMASGLASGISHSGITPAGYAAFGFALGVTAGLFIRRTLPAMAVTLAVYTAVIIAFPIWVQPHLIPPVQATMALPASSAMNMQVTNNMLQPQTLQSAPGDTGAPAGSWVLSTSQVVNQDGRPVHSVPAQACGPTPSSQACAAYIESLHLRQTVTYQPASRYWAFQWIETAIYLALSLLLAGLCFLRIRPGRPAAPDIARPGRLAPALERSP
jgi:ABC-type transport system involved in multi-copper enzyme maturation permease subunit